MMFAYGATQESVTIILALRQTYCISIPTRGPPNLLCVLLNKHSPWDDKIFAVVVELR